MAESILSMNKANTEKSFIKKYGIYYNPEDDLCELQKRWYKSLEQNSPDYSVYNDKIYNNDLIECWFLYSRKYLKILQRPDIYIKFSKINTILDLGCGIGFTCVGLKEVFPKSKVIGLNLEKTLQINYAKKLSKIYNFEIKSDINKIKDNIDLVFASEFFEHIYEPIDYLQEIIAKFMPTYFVIANSFNTISIGHFNNYSIDGSLFKKDQVGRIFNTQLRNFGYKKVDVKIWNSRPSIYYLE